MKKYKPMIIGAFCAILITLAVGLINITFGSNPQMGLLITISVSTIYFFAAVFLSYRLGGRATLSQTVFYLVCLGLYWLIVIIYPIIASGKTDLDGYDLLFLAIVVAPFKDIFALFNSIMNDEILTILISSIFIALNISTFFVGKALKTKQTKADENKKE